ncbi:transposable element Tc1 transposase [Trichonephila clavipes]|nr:transposable element Tc1 transposase [Trichonephila clavipes]
MGHSISAIVRDLGFSTWAVSRVNQEYIDGGLKTSDRGNCKGQFALTVHGERRLRRIERSQTLTQITTHRRPTRVPWLNARHRVARLAWAKEHSDWSIEDWKRVARNDESRLQLLIADGRLRIWRQAHESVDPACQQDFCTSQKCRLPTGWLDEHFSDFSVINWPPRSPDLNPIKHLWKVLEQGVKGHHTSSTDLTELWIVLANIWQVIPVERFQKLVESIPRSVAARGDPAHF